MMSMIPGQKLETTPLRHPTPPGFAGRRAPRGAGNWKLILSASCFSLISIFFISVFPAEAHRSGCHNLHTCASDNNSYTCGDLGYPCNGATTLEQINAADVFVPLAVEKAFTNIFGRKPTDSESQYWKKRFRADKESVYQIRRAMTWHKGHASSGPVPAASPAPARLSKEDLVKNMNTMFTSVYGRDHTVSENRYWISRLKDKPTAPGIIGAMTYHRDNNIQH